MAEAVADKGYHSNETMVDLAAVGVRSYIAEPGPGPPVLEGRARGSGCGVCEPPSDTGQSGPGVAAASWRVAGAAVRASIRHGGHAAGAPARAFEHSETGAGPCRGWQPRAASASSDRCRHAPWPPRAGRVGCMGADQAVGRPVGRSRAGLGCRFCQICRPQPRYRAVRPSSPPFEHRGLLPRAVSQGDLRPRGGLSRRTLGGPGATCLRNGSLVRWRPRRCGSVQLWLRLRVRRPPTGASRA